MHRSIRRSRNQHLQKFDPSKGELHYAKHLHPKNRILSGPRNLKDGLWDLHIPSTSSAASNQSTLHQANTIIRKDKSKTKIEKYLHAAAGYPVISTFIQAIKKGNFLSWPGIESILFKKHLPKSMATTKGHLYQERKNLQSTKIQIKLEDSDYDHFPEKIHSIEKLIRLQHFYSRSVRLAKHTEISLAASPTSRQGEINIFL